MLNRLVLFTKLSQQSLRPKVATNSIQKRYSSDDYYGYREINYEPKRRWMNPLCQVLGGVMWWWIFWNCWSDWKHLIGHYPWPERSKWSDEHLGIPPDDYED